MTQITVSSTVVPNYRGGGVSATLRIFAGVSFTTSDDVRIMQGRKDDWYKTVTCSVSSTDLTIPEFTLDSTVDSSEPNATYSGIFYDSNGNEVDYLFYNYRVPILTPLTWEAFHAFNAGTRVRLGENFLNADEVAALIASVGSGKLDATALVSESLADNFEVTSSTTLSKLNWSLNVEAATYSIYGYLYVICDADGGFKYDFGGGSATASGSRFLISSIINEVDTPSTFPIGGMTNLTDVKTVTGYTSFTITLTGIVTFATAGTFNMRAAQAVSDGNATTLWNYSNIVLTKL